jgi:hypothetical protein
MKSSILTNTKKKKSWLLAADSQRIIDALGSRVARQPKLSVDRGIPKYEQGLNVKSQDWRWRILRSSRLAQGFVRMPKAEPMFSRPSWLTQGRYHGNGSHTVNAKEQ